MEHTTEQWRTQAVRHFDYDWRHSPVTKLFVLLGKTLVFELSCSLFNSHILLHMCWARIDLWSCSYCYALLLWISAASMEHRGRSPSLNSVEHLHLLLLAHSIRTCKCVPPALPNKAFNSITQRDNWKAANVFSRKGVRKGEWCYWRSPMCYI